MKKINVYAAVLLMAFQTIALINYGQANNSLSNLKAPVAVNVDLLPKQFYKLNLGTQHQNWKMFFLDSSIYLKSSLFIHKSGINSAYIGEKAGSAAQASSHDNVGAGFNCLTANSSGNDNIGIGANVLLYNNTGSFNTGVGWGALYENKNSNNTSFGAYSLLYNSTGESNTAIGISAASYNQSGTYNTATGKDAMLDNDLGNYNTADGYKALETMQLKDANTAVGAYSLSKLAIHANNTALGYYAGNIYTGDNNTFVGVYAMANNDNFSNSSALGYQATVTASNQVRIGNLSTTSIGGKTSWSSLSDGRVKKNIKQNVPGLAFINKLIPVTYNLNYDALNAITKTGFIKDEKGNAIKASPEDLNAKKAQEQVVYTGLNAQQTQQAAKETGYDFSGVDAAKNSTDVYGLRYSDFVMPLIKAVQELDRMREEKDIKIKNLQAKIDQLKKLINSNQ